VSFTSVELPIFRYTNANVAPLGEDAISLMRAMIAIAGRYLAMAATGWGVGSFQEAPAAGSWTTPGVLLTLPVLLILAARLATTTRRRCEEAVYWWWAALSFAPVSQLFPFIFPIADRYLYFILPGLIGGGALAAASSPLGRWVESDGSRLRRRALVACFACWLVVFALHAHGRAALWAAPENLDREAMRNHPEGLLAHQALAREAATRGDVEATVEHLRFVSDRGQIEFTSYRNDPVWAPVRDDPRFQELVRHMARQWIALEPLFQRPSQIELRGLAHAHWIAGDLREAKERLERALEVGGLRDAQIRRELVSLRLALQREGEQEAQPTDADAERSE
jgi:hypothetical protein